MKRYLIVVLLCSLAASFNKVAAQHPAALDKTVQALMKEHHIPAVAIGMIKEGSVSFTKVYGELSPGTPAPPNTIFNVASLTKPVVTMLTLKLVSLGKWDLDAPLADYWIDPDVKNDSNAYKLTARHVLSHQTGFVNWRWLHATKKLTFDFPPGTRFQYSGEGFEYLKKALEQKFHQSLDKLCNSLIFTPLKMRDTRFTWDDRLESHFAKWHDKDGKNVYKTGKRDSASAADDLLTTVADYSRFGEAVINGFDLPQNLFREIVTPKVSMGKNSSMTLGWEYFGELPHNEVAILHTGSDIGVKTLILLFPRSKQGLVIFTNSDNGYLVYEKLIKEAMGELGAAFLKKAQ